MNNDYKLIALDIDGTLLDSRRNLRPRVKKALQLATAKGCIVTLATGRRHRSARHIAKELEINTPLILYNGGVVYDTEAEEVLLHRPLEPSFVALALELLLENGLRPGVLQSPIGGEHIYLGPADNDDAFLRQFAADPTRRDLVIRCSYSELALVNNAMTVIAGGSLAVSELVLEVIKSQNRLECNFFSYNLIRSTPDDFYGFDILPIGQTKAFALAWLAAYHGLRLDQTIAIGDSFNDIEMLAAAGLGIAMGNAPDQVKAAANCTVGTNDQEGVAQAIEKFILS